MTGQNEIVKFNRYAKTHPMGGPVSDFEKNFYGAYLQNFSGKILDIGCGDGKYIHYFHEESPDSFVVPCDLSYRRIERVYQNGFGGVVGLAEALPYRSGSFDMVFLMQVIEHVPKPAEVIAECKRVLKPSGYFFILPPNYPIKRVYDWIEVFRYQKWKKFFDDSTHCSKFSENRLRKMLQNHFRQIDIRPTFLIGEGHFPFIKAWRDRRISSMFFCHKLVAACRF